MRDRRRDCSSDDGSGLGSADELVADRGWSGEGWGGERLGISMRWAWRVEVYRGISDNGVQRYLTGSLGRDSGFRGHWERKFSRQRIELVG